MKAKIYKPTKTAMQSGRFNTKKWVLEFEQKDKRFNNPLIGWIGSTDMRQELLLRFENKDEAVNYAKKHGIEYELIQPNKRKIIIQTYADNFK